MSDTFSVLVANHGIQADILNASEQIRLNHRILSGQVCNQLFDIIPLGSARAAAAQAVFREAAGTLNEVQFIGISPGLDILLPDEIQRADQLHPFEMLALQSRHHCLDFSGVQHAHQNRLNDVIIMMTKCDLVTPKLLRMTVEISTSHSRTEIAWIFVNLRNRIENLCIENSDVTVNSVEGILLREPVGLIDNGSPEVHENSRELSPDVLGMLDTVRLRDIRERVTRGLRSRRGEVSVAEIISENTVRYGLQEVVAYVRIFHEMKARVIPDVYDEIEVADNRNRGRRLRIRLPRQVTDAGI